MHSSPRKGKTEHPGQGHFRPFAERMEQRAMPDMVVNQFRKFYDRLAEGATGKLSGREIEPLGEDGPVPLAELRPYENLGRKHLDKVCLIKLNGGLGTSMGLKKAKSLIEVKEGRTFLDVIRGQVEHLRSETGAEVPLVLMNSFRTRDDSLAAMRGFDNSARGLPLDFLQHAYPKIVRRTLAPAECPRDPELEWNPPGHGDIYAALCTSGLLDKLIDAGVRYAFVSNSDNLGATLELSILGYLVRSGAPFLMEAARRTEADKKGGHLARTADGRLALREVAQCPDDELDEFQDVKRFRYFNTNSIWLDLAAVREVILKRGRVPVEMIVNEKTLDPRDESSTEVYQLESAMGSAISAFEGARVVEVPRTRFLPVKTVNDLLNIMSDNYRLKEDMTIVPERGTTPTAVRLDMRYFKKIDQFQRRFAGGIPSLAQCERLEVVGDVHFREPVDLSGEVRIENANGSAARVGEEDVEKKSGTIRID